MAACTSVLLLPPSALGMKPETKLSQRRLHRVGHPGLVWGAVFFNLAQGKLLRSCKYPSAIFPQTQILPSLA